MAKKIGPFEVDELLIQLVLILFLAVNYNQPLADIYFKMALISLLAYVIPFALNLTGIQREMIPFTKSGTSKPLSVTLGIGLGIGFIYVYGLLVASGALAFASAPILAGSVIVTNLVFGILIPAVETVFFFRAILAWVAYLIKKPARVSPFSMTGILYMVGLGAFFAWFHFTVRGLNDIEMFATFFFGVVSVGVVLYFKQMLEAVMLHITTNLKALGLLTLALSPSMIVIWGGILLYAFSDLILDRRLF